MLWLPRAQALQLQGRPSRNPYKPRVLQNPLHRIVYSPQTLVLQHVKLKPILSSRHGQGVYHSV